MIPQNISSLIILFGITGAGRSSALQYFSDIGYYALDNLPVSLFSEFLDQTKKFPHKYTKTALTLDADFRSGAKELMALIEGVKNPSVKIVFIDADTETIIKRYSETRRPHPDFDATVDKSLEDTVQRERNVLEPIKFRSHLVLDSSGLSIHDLRRELLKFVASIGLSEGTKLRVNFVSFGFKYGAPRDCDLIVDIRFLPNPYFVEKLRDKAGTDQEVSNFVLDTEDAKEFIEKYSSLLFFLLPKYKLEGKSYLSIGIGCTGGKHRSVAIAEKLAQIVGDSQYSVSVKHRDITR